jgi:hypothetical protein
VGPATLRLLIRAIALLAATLALVVPAGAEALTLQQVGPAFDHPIYVTSDPGKAGRLLVVERAGTVRLVESGNVSLFTDISAAVQCCEDERGLASIALDPDFDANGRLYLDYTGREEPGEIHVAEMIAAPDRRSAGAGTLKDLFTIPHGVGSTHNGGQLQFGPDGRLYVSTGDGGGSNDELHNAQNPASRLGKILRLDPDDPGAAEIWSLGLRNPFRFSFDSLDGDMVIGDVGQAKREEIDFAPSPFPGVVGGQGANYGWNCREGLIAGPGDDPECAAPPAGGFVDPVLDYPHSSDPNLACGGAVTGGYVVRDANLGALYGRYVYSDYCIGDLRALQLPATAAGPAGGDCSLGLHVEHPFSFGEDAAHRLYVTDEAGHVYRLVGQPPASCPPTPRTQAPPLAAEEAKPTFVGIKAQRRRVERRRRALLTVFVSPCVGRRGESVTLLRHGRPNGTKFLSRACTARFAPQIRRGTTFAAFTHEGRGYAAGHSRKLTVRIAHRHRRHR